MIDPSLITSLGVPGFALWILWMSYKEFMKRIGEKDIEQIKERISFNNRLDAKDENMRRLELDIRSNLTTALIENSNTNKEVMLFLKKP